MKKHIFVCALFLITNLIYVLPYSFSGEDIYDKFYNDDTTASLNFIGDDNWGQTHNFWAHGDADWVLFNIDPHRPYTIKVSDQATSCNAAIYCYNSNDLSHTIFPVEDFQGAGGGDEIISWTTGDTSGTILVKIMQSTDDADLYGEGTTYTLTITGDWGPSTGLATISGTTTDKIYAPIGGNLCVPNSGYVYTKHKLYFPPDSLTQDVEFAIGAPKDIGNNPYFKSQEKWKNLHEGNYSIVQIYPLDGFSDSIIKKPLTLTMQFVDGPIDIYSGGLLVDTLDDIPSDAEAYQMRIYKWYGDGDEHGDFSLVEGEQTVAGDTVTATISEIGSGVFGCAPYKNPSGITDWQIYE